MTTRTARGLTVGAGLAAAALLLGSCTDGGDEDLLAPGEATEQTAGESPGVVPGTPPGMESPSTSPGTAQPASAPFGPGCSDLPNGGQLPDQPTVEALGDVPRLSQLTSALAVAGLTDDIDQATDITVFAPTDEAFQSLSAGRLADLLSDPQGIGQILQYHVVTQQLSPDELAGDHPTLEGTDLTVTGSGEDFTVGDDASVVCGNLTTGNATVYVIDSVLMPPS